MKKSSSENILTNCLPAKPPLCTSAVRADDKVGSIWRLPRYDGNANAVWPNYQRHVTHHK